MCTLRPARRTPTGGNRENSSAVKHTTPTPKGVGVVCSATGSGHVITCTPRRWVVSGGLYCFQHPPAYGRREACKPSTDPTSRITDVRINRAAAHRSPFLFGVFSANTSLPLLDVHKVRRRRCASSWRKIHPKKRGFPCCLRRAGLLYTKYSGTVSSSAGRKISAKGTIAIFSALPALNLLDVHKVRRRFAICRTKNHSSSSERICSMNRS